AVLSVRGNGSGLRAVVGTRPLSDVRLHPPIGDDSRGRLHGRLGARRVAARTPGRPESPTGGTVRMAGDGDRRVRRDLTARPRVGAPCLHWIGEWIPAERRGGARARCGGVERGGGGGGPSGRGGGSPPSPCWCPPRGGPPPCRCSRAPLPAPSAA